MIGTSANGFHDGKLRNHEQQLVQLRFAGKLCKNRSIIELIAMLGHALTLKQYRIFMMRSFCQRHPGHHDRQIEICIPENFLKTKLALQKEDLMCSIIRHHLH